MSGGWSRYTRRASSGRGTGCMASLVSAAVVLAIIGLMVLWASSARSQAFDPCSNQGRQGGVRYDCRNHVPKGAVCRAVDPKQTKGTRVFECVLPKRRKSR